MRIFASWIDFFQSAQFFTSPVFNFAFTYIWLVNFTMTFKYTRHVILNDALVWQQNTETTRQSTNSSSCVFTGCKEVRVYPCICCVYSLVHTMSLGFLTSVWWLSYNDFKHLTSLLQQLYIYMHCATRFVDRYYCVMAVDNSTEGNVGEEESGVSILWARHECGRKHHQN